MTNIEKNPNENENRDVVAKHLKVIEENKITDCNGNLVFDAKTLIKGCWHLGEVIIVTPEISLSELKEPLIKELNLCASNPMDPLDLKVITHISPEEINKSSGLGIEYTHEMDVHLFPKEFFNSTPNAKEIFYKKFFPKIGVFEKYDHGYAT